MSTNLHIGTDHIFTNFSNGEIVLEAGQNKTLEIQGTVNTESINIDGLSLDLNSMNDVEIIGQLQDDILVFTAGRWSNIPITDVFSGTAAGSNQEIQFNNSGAFGADSKYFYDKSTDLLTASIISATTYVSNIFETNKLTVDSAIATFSGTVIGVNTGSFSAGGPNLSIQFNDSSQFNGSNSLVMNGSLNGLTASNIQVSTTVNNTSAIFTGPVSTPNYTGGNSFDPITLNATFGQSSSTSSSLGRVQYLGPNKDEFITSNNTTIRLYSGSGILSATTIVNAISYAMGCCYCNNQYIMTTVAAMAKATNFNSWTTVALSTSARLALASSSTTAILVTETDPQIYVTTNNFTSWTTVALGLNLGFDSANKYDHVLAVYESTPDKFIVTDRDTYVCFYNNDNTYLTWTTISGYNGYRRVGSNYEFYNDIGNDDLVLQSTDFITWTTVNYKVPTRGRYVYISDDITMNTYGYHLSNDACCFVDNSSIVPYDDDRVSISRTFIDGSMAGVFYDIHNCLNGPVISGNLSSSITFYTAGPPVITNIYEDVESFRVSNNECFFTEYTSDPTEPTIHGLAVLDNELNIIYTNGKVENNKRYNNLFKIAYDYVNNVIFTSSVVDSTSIQMRDFDGNIIKNIVSPDVTKPKISDFRSRNGRLFLLVKQSTSADAVVYYMNNYNLNKITWISYGASPFTQISINDSGTVVGTDTVASIQYRKTTDGAYNTITGAVYARIEIDNNDKLYGVASFKIFEKSVLNTTNDFFDTGNSSNNEIVVRDGLTFGKSGSAIVSKNIPADTTNTLISYYPTAKVQDFSR